MSDQWYAFEASWGTVYVNAVSMTDAREWARVWIKGGKYAGRIAPGKDAHTLATTEARAAQIKKANEARLVE